MDPASDACRTSGGLLSSAFAQTRDFRRRTRYSLVVTDQSAARPGVEINLVAIHSDQQQMLVDQSSNAIRIPRLSIPHPLVIQGQSMTSRFTGIIQDRYGLRGRVLALHPGLSTADGNTLFVIFLAQEAGLASRLDRQGFRWREIATLQELSDQDASAKLQAALNLVRARRISDELEEAWTSKLDRVFQLLRERMAEKDGLIGWTQFLTGESVGVLSTAQGILTFLEAGSPGHNVESNLETLRKLQNPDGGWPVRRALIGHSERSITESTVYSLWALSRAGTDLQDPAILRGIEWLEQAQLKDGGWGSTSAPSRPRIYPTAFASQYLAEAAGNTAAVKQAVNWLREAQNPDGGWGPLKASDPTRPRGSTAVHTARAILALLASGIDSTDTSIDGGVRYLRSSLRAGDTEPWPSTSEVETVDEDAALDFRHFTTPWVICALLDSGAPIGDPVVTAGIQWLLAEQHTLGYWSSQLAPGQTPMWATFDALHALSKVRDTALGRISDLFDADAKSIELDFAWTSYFLALDQIRSDENWRSYRRIGWMYAWNAALTFVVVLLLLYRSPLSSSLSTAGKILGSALIGLVPGFGPFVYQVIADWINGRRGKVG